MTRFRRFSITMLILISGCASLPTEIEHLARPFAAVPSNSLSELIEMSSARPVSPNLSAVLLQETGWDALSQRLSLVEQAEHSIDIQYYIWNSDISGRYLASRLVAAANRGVRVRVLLDDINLNEREELLATLDQHPQIDIRIFNPIPSRRGLAKWLNVLGDFSRLNRRMHNKSFTVDGAFSVVGGRNIGDEYFDLSEHLNFRDRDALVAGEVVSAIRKSFQEYWTSRWSYPVELLTDSAALELGMIKDVELPHYAYRSTLPQNKKVAAQLLGDLIKKMHWVEASYVSDQPIPEDTDDSDQPKATARLLGKLANEAGKSILLESAYLILDDRQLKELQGLADRGVVIKALTNSMASNDLLTNHSGYAGRREELLAGGMQLYELKPDASLCFEAILDPERCTPKASYGLHSKSVVFDKKVSGVGSFNLNLRSTYLNTESLLIIEDEDFSISLAESIEHAMELQNSWQLKLLKGRVHWLSGDDDWTKEPETSVWQRVKSRFLQLLPIEKYL